MVFAQNRQSRRSVRQWTAACCVMHELGIAVSILECVQKEAQRHPGVAHQQGGRAASESFAGVDADALQFGFEMLVKDTDFEPLALEMESVPRMQRCPNCGHEFRMTEFDPRCPLVRRVHHRSASAAKNSISPIWKWMNESHCGRKKSSERKPDPGRAAARALSQERCAVREPDQLSRLGQDGAAGTHARAHGQEHARRGADRRSAD